MRLVVNARFLTQEVTGVQRYALELSKLLKKYYKDEIIFLSPKNIIQHEIANKLDVLTIGTFKGHLWEQIDLPYFLRQKKSPLLVNFANTAPLFYRNKIVTVHDIAYERFPKNFNWKFRLFYKILIPNIIKTSRHIITVSNFSKMEINDLYKARLDNISVVYNAVNNDFKPKQKDSKEKYILAVSSLSYQKNFHSLIKAFNQLTNKKIKLFLVGSINRNFANISLLNDIENNKNIIFRGRVSDNELISLYSNAICFVTPSLYEGFGIPPLEAQTCGCPVICSNAASLPEVCGDSVVYFNPYDIDDMSKKIEIVINDEKLQKELVQKGFENIKRFSWEKSVDKLIKIIENLK